MIISSLPKSSKLGRRDHGVGRRALTGTQFVNQISQDAVRARNDGFRALHDRRIEKNARGAQFELAWEFAKFQISVRE